MSLMNQHSSLMNALGLETFLVDTSLQPLIEELIESQTQDIIEFKFFMGEKTISVHSVKKGSTFEQSSWVFFLKCKQFSGSLSEFSEKEVNSPDFSLVLKTVFAD